MSHRHHQLYAAIPAVRAGRSNLDLAQLFPDPEPWMDEGLCAQVDPEAWFPERGGSTRDAKRICLGCPVRVECLRYAVDHNEHHGVWGGMSERERRKLKPGGQAPRLLSADFYDQRAAVVQHLTEQGWTFSQIGDELGVTPDVARKAWRRARRLEVAS